MTRELAVYMQEVFAGVLTDGGLGAMRFVYDSQYLTSGGIALSLSLPVDGSASSEVVTGAYGSMEAGKAELQSLSALTGCLRAEGQTMVASTRRHSGRRLRGSLIGTGLSLAPSSERSPRLWKTDCCN